MYIDGDTHYWPVRFIERVNHPGRGHIEFTKGGGEMIRFGESFPGDAATYYRDGKKIHSFSETRWNLDMHREVMAREGFDYQVVIADNRPLIYEVERDLGVAMARAYNDTVAEEIAGKDYFIGIAWEDYLPQIVEVWPDHNIIIGSDFDHGDAISTWPNTVAPIKAMKGISDEDKERILGGNAVRLFGMKG